MSVIVKCETPKSRKPKVRLYPTSICKVIQVCDSPCSPCPPCPSPCRPCPPRCLPCPPPCQPCPPPCPPRCPPPCSPCPPCVQVLPCRSTLVRCTMKQGGFLWNGVAQATCVVYPPSPPCYYVPCCPSYSPC